MPSMLGSFKLTGHGRTQQDHIIIFIITRMCCVLEQCQTIIKHPQRQPLHVGQKRWRAQVVIRQGGWGSGAAARAPCLMNDHERSTTSHERSCSDHAQAKRLRAVESSWQGSQSQPCPDCTDHALRPTDTAATHRHTLAHASKRARPLLQPKRVLAVSKP